MAQGEFTKEEGKETKDAVKEMFSALPKSKGHEYVERLNNVLTFLSAAIEAAPKEKSD